MFKTNRRLIIVVMSCCIAAVISILAFAAANTSIKLSFTGMELIKNGDYTQAFLDVTVKNVNTNGVAFCLQYDSCLDLSDAATGRPLKETAAFAEEYYGLEHFVQNEDNFPMNPRDTFFTEDGFKGNADLTKKYLFMYFMPIADENENPMNPSSHVFIKTIDGYHYGEIHADNPRGLNIGKISFTVSDLNALANKTPAELEQLIQIVPFDTLNLGGLFPIEEQDTGVYISYYDEDDDDQQKFYSEGETEIKLDTKIYDISADVKEAEISALDIYNTGTQQDLIDYLNSHMSDITIKYTDEATMSDRFIWDPNDPTFECSASWDAKGGEYTVTQEHPNGFTIEVHVKVLPVTIDHLYTDDAEITYAADSETFPTSVSELSLPDKVHVVLSPSSTTKGLADLPVELILFNGSSLGKDLPDEFKNKTPGSYPFTVSVGNVDFETIAPWLTPSSDRTVTVKRNIVETSAELPKKLVADAQTTDDGQLIINLHYEDNSPIDPNTDFTIRMQDGSLLDISSMGSNYNVDFNGDGTATITISPDINDTYQKDIAKKINLGSRIGEYAVSAKEPSKYPSEFVKFSSDPRLNKYTESYTFDFSGLDSLTFPIASNGKPSEIITLPGTSRVGTTYSGYDGSEPGSLKTVIVDSWSEPTDNGDGTFTVIGTMSETTYTGYGKVENPDGYTIEIKYKVSSDISMEDESIDDIEDFRFDTKQVGYDYDELQSAEFTIKNTGTADIKGLSVTIEVQDNDEQGCFALVNPLPSTLDIGQTAVFTIMNLKGLGIKDHKAKVTISSDNNKELDTFFIWFNVIEGEAFKIKLNSNNKDFGSAKTQSGQNTAAYDDDVTIIATPAEDCKFVRWEAVKDSDGTTFPLDNTDTVSFKMPDSDLTITAVFEEMGVANLRLEDLQVKNPDLSDNQLCDKDWKPITFDPVTREYFVVEPTDTETNSLWFKLREEGKDCEVTVTHTKISKDMAGNVVNSVTDPVNYSIDDDVYKTDWFTLEDGPTNNLLTITMAKKDSNGDIMTDDDGNRLEKSYIVHIRKLLTEDKMVTFRYGNSPYGLIMEDDSITDKEKAKEEFIKNKNRFAKGYIPSGGDPEIRYTTEAWQNTNNYDRSNTALFVVGREEFDDPGWDKLTNSIGDPVALEDVQRSLISIKKMIMNNNWGTEEDFSNAQMDELDPIYIANRTDGRTDVTINDLMTYRVRPDIYSIKYEFTDYDGRPKTLYRPLIVLPSLGDIDIDGATDPSDALRITNRFENIIPYQITQENRNDNYEKGKMLYRYRVCDVNKDKNVNSIDENTINSNQVKQFYTNKKVVSAQ